MKLRSPRAVGFAPVQQTQFGRAAQLLALPDCRNLGVIGCTPDILDAVLTLDAQFELERICILAADKSSRQALSVSLQDRINTPVYFPATERDAVFQAGLVLLGRPACLIRDWLRPGAVIFLPETQPAAQLLPVIDRWIFEHAAALPAPDSARISGRSASLGDVLAGKAPGRLTPEDIILYSFCAAAPAAR